MTVPGPSYPGNPALSPEVRLRVETTFRQSQELAARGNRQEASLGCDFVLQLDPDFAPAQELLARLESGAPIAGRPSSRHAEADELFGGSAGGGEELPDLFDLPELPELHDFDAATPAAPAAPGASVAAPPAAPSAAADSAPAAAPGAAVGPGLADRLAALVAAGRHGEAVALAQANREALAADPRAAELAETAAARQEAAPYVERFLAQAAEARRQGDEAAARAHLDKAASLDPTHPGLAAAAAAPAFEGVPGIDPEATVFAGSPGALPGAAAPPPAGGEPDPFAALGGSDEERRIGDLLAEGQAAFDRGDHQAAIDAWSRIFLIDIDNAEAARRIEEARRLKAEQERAVEEVFHDAEAALSRGDREAAREGYERVLAAQPGHVEARQRLEGLDGGGDELTAAIGAAAAAAGMTGAAPAPGAAPAADAPPAREPLREEILVPPEPGEEAPAAAADAGAGRRLVAVRESRAGRRFALIGTLVLLAVAAAGYLVWDNRARIFPNAEEAAAPVVEEDAIARATRLHRAGRTAIAINQLRRLPPSSPEYDEAQALISQWEAESAAPPAGAAPAEDADPAVAARQALIEEARLAAERGEYLVALSRLEQAAEEAPLEGEAAALHAQIERDLAPVARLVDLVRQGEHERALPDLWRRHEADPADRVVRYLLVEAYYRMGARDLQRGDAAAAAEHLGEAAALAPDDPLLARHQRFAESYAEREKDLLYRIYVKYLPSR